MIKEFVEAWNKNKTNLEYFIKSHKTEEYDDYCILIKYLFKTVINPYIEFSFDKFDTDNILIIDDGDYQGTQIFILHKKCHYHPSIEDYVYTSVCYGSCAACDTLWGIQNYNYDYPNQEQITDYMTLCLHLLQNFHYMKGE